ncbi:hypothetical protein BGZ82_008913 [Podila clonocystis]|nr:hypothetical protein BGZ82_008913 [Podila clonocystis]
MCSIETFSEDIADTVKIRATAEDAHSVLLQTILFTSRVFSMALVMSTKKIYSTVSNYHDDKNGFERATSLNA